MKILFLTENYFPKVSGVPVVCRYLAEGLLDKGHNVTIATRDTTGLPEIENIAGVTVHRFKLWQSLLKRPMGDIKGYIKYVCSANVDVIVFECAECITTDLILPYLDELKCKKILHSHGLSGLTKKMFKWNVNLYYTIGNTYNYLRFQYYHRFWFKKYIGKFDETLCLSDVDSGKKYQEKYAKHVTVLQNAVDDMFWDETKPNTIAPFTTLNKPYFVSVATYSKQKNQIAILKEFYKSDCNCALVFVGPSETEYYQLLQEKVKELTRKYGKRDVYTLVDIPRKYIPDIIGNATLYLVASKFEEYSISLIETMAKGVPFISNNIGNARILPGGITLDDISDMHNKIKLLLSDEKLYKELCEKGRFFAKNNCRREYAVNKLEEIITQISK